MPTFNTVGRKRYSMVFFAQPDVDELHGLSLILHYRIHGGKDSCRILFVMQSQHRAFILLHASWRNESAGDNGAKLILRGGGGNGLALRLWPGFALAVFQGGGYLSR